MQKIHLQAANANASGSAGSAGGTTVTSKAWLEGVRFSSKEEGLNANQRTSLSAMIAYIALQSGLSEFRIERQLADQFNIPNAKCLAANDYDKAILYLADILPAER